MAMFRKDRPKYGVGGQRSVLRHGDKSALRDAGRIGKGADGPGKGMGERPGGWSDLWAIGTELRDADGVWVVVWRNGLYVTARSADRGELATWKVQTDTGALRRVEG